MVRPGEKLTKWRFSEDAKNAIFIFFANTLNASFNCCTSITWLSALKKLPDLNDAMLQT